MKTYKIYLTSAGIQVQDQQGLVCSVPGNWDDFINQSQLFQHCASLNFQDAKIVIKGCSKESVPTEAYLKITQLLQPVAKSLFFGEPCSTVPLFKRK